MNKSFVKSFIVLLILIAIVSIYYLFSISVFKTDKSDASRLSRDYDLRQIVVGGRRFKAYIADSEEKRERGLGGVTGLSKNESMLFVFDEPEEYDFWMKDMQIPIDLICIDDANEVLKIYRGLYPQSYPKVFKCPFPTKYGLEIKSGEVNELDLVIGNKFEMKK